MQTEKSGIILIGRIDVEAACIICESYKVNLGKYAYYAVGFVEIAISYISFTLIDMQSPATLCVIEHTRN